MGVTSSSAASTRRLSPSKPRWSTRRRAAASTAARLSLGPDPRPAGGAGTGSVYAYTGGARGWRRGRRGQARADEGRRGQARGDEGKPGQARASQGQGQLRGARPPPGSGGVAVGGGRQPLQQVQQGALAPVHVT